MNGHRRKFLSTARQHVLHQLISGWRRRGASLLQIGLNGGFSPEFFWEAGFDVSALDRSPDCLAAAREQTGPKIEYVCGNAELLPFDDGAFDYAVLMHHGLAPGRDGRSVMLDEALRVSSHGVIILEWNRFSLAGKPRTVWEGWPASAGEDSCDVLDCPSCGSAEKSVFPWDLYRLARRSFKGGRIVFRSALPLWEGTWPASEGGLLFSMRNALMPLNLTPSPVPLGALIGLRMDWTPLPLTPVGMLRSAAASLYPARPQREEVIGRHRDGAA